MNLAPLALSLSKGFDKLSPNGLFPIILSLSKDKLSPNGLFPSILSLSKDKLSPNGLCPARPEPVEGPVMWHAWAGVAA